MRRMTSGIQARGGGVSVSMSAGHLDGPEVEPVGSEFEISRVFATQGEDDVDGRHSQAHDQDHQDARPGGNCR